LFVDSTLTGTTGNTDVGLDLTNARGCVVVANSLPTLTGVAGNIRDAGGNILTWAQIAATGYVDRAGNRFVSVDTSPLAILAKFSGVFFYSAVGAAFHYMSDEGIVLPTVNNTDPIRYPTSLRIISRLRVTCISGTGADVPTTVTLYRAVGAGVPAATLQTITIPAATGAFTGFVDLANPIVFADGDQFDIRVDAAATAAETDMSLSVTLEGPCS
jgi:hypothetical protein